MYKKELTLALENLIEAAEGIDLTHNKLSEVKVLFRAINAAQDLFAEIESEEKDSTKWEWADFKNQCKKEEGL